MLRQLGKQIKVRFGDGSAAAVLLHSLYWFFAIVYWELVLHIAAFGAPELRFGYVLGFSVPVSVVLGCITALMPGRGRGLLLGLLTGFLTVLYCSQMVYYFIFGTLYSAAMIQQGGDAMTSFWRELLLTMRDNLPALLTALVPGALLLLAGIFRRGRAGRCSFLWCLVLLAASLAVQFAMVQCLKLGGTGYFSDYYFYYSDSTTMDQSVSRFGLLTAFRLELATKETPRAEEETYYIPETKPLEPAPTQPQETLPGETQPQEPVKTHNILEIDFDALSAMTEDKKLQAINRYCASLPGTGCNEYTGMLSDYNLIVLCAESFSTGAIHPELTPTLYRLANEGLVFKNFYNTYPNNTSDGEYTLCTGLYPDLTRYKEAPSFYASRASYLPYCLGNIFAQQRGIQSYGYHNHIGTYYGRNESHPNMGYVMKFQGDGLNLVEGWPTSDLEMMEQSVDDYIGQEQFHAYYMTFSGHLLYKTEANSMASRNWEQVKDLPISSEARCYLACHIELDKALEYLLQRLEAEGVADRTAIVLVGDHYPYGLYNYQYSELVGYAIDDFTRQKSSLLFWVGGLEENIVVEEYCCNADILPTILNLWGFDFDSRMLAGTDVFSDGTHVAVLSDKSFFTDKVWLNGSTGEIRYQVDPSEVPQGYVEDMIRLIETKFSLSADILNTAYYNFVFGKDPVSVDREQWE